MGKDGMKDNNPRWDEIEKEREKIEDVLLIEISRKMIEEVVNGQ